MGKDERCYQASLFELVGKEGLEPSRLAAHDPKSRLSANSSTSPIARCSLQVYWETLWEIWVTASGIPKKPLCVLDYKREPHERQ